MSIFFSHLAITKDFLEIIKTDWAGWATLVLTYFIAYFWISEKKNKVLLFVIFLVLTLHHSIAFINAYITTTYGAANDAAMFHRTAIQIVTEQASAHFGSGAHFYRLILAFFYKTFGISLFFGEELSILVFLISCFVFIKICELMNFTKDSFILLLLYGCLPSMLFFGSITLREIWQILFLMLTIYFCLQNLQTGSYKSCLGYLFFSFILALFHEGFVIFNFILAGVLIFFQLSKIFQNNFTFSRGQVFSIFATFLTVLIAYAMLYSAPDKTPELASFHSISKGHALQYIEYYRTIGFPGRTNYNVIFDTSSLLNLMITFGSAFTYYMFAPFPWEITNFFDFYAGFESLLRFSLLLTAIYVCYKMQGNSKRLMIFLLLTYFMLSLLWSLGTRNYGTCVRHHIVGFWMLLIFLGAFLQHRFTERHYLN